MADKRVIEDGVIADYWISDNESKESNVCASGTQIFCLLCPHRCQIPDGKTGRCGARRNVGGTLYAATYGKISSIALDPIEKKPLYHCHPGKMILSVGSVGCNFHCPFCQNHKISMEYDGINLDYISPAELAQIAKKFVQEGNIGVAYTYNEPLIGFEYVRDCAKLVRDAGLMNVLVTNGFINEKPLLEILPFVDAMNIDIKAATDRTYNMFGGTLETVKQTVKRAYESCHIEITTLAVPNINEDDIEKIATFIASLDKKIPYHISRYFPRYKYKDREPTQIDVMKKYKDIASKYLDNVYLGNM